MNSPELDLVRQSLENSNSKLLEVDGSLEKDLQGGLAPLIKPLRGLLQANLITNNAVFGLVQKLSR
jgi:hypothetical protein